MTLRAPVEVALAHPHVVKLEGFGFWPEDTREFVVVFMEYVEGRRLDVWAYEENLLQGRPRARHMTSR